MSRQSDGLTLRVAVAEALSREGLLSIGLFNADPRRQAINVDLLRQWPELFQPFVHARERVSHSESRDRYADQQSRLLRLGSRADQEARLQVLWSISGIRRSDANNSTDG